MAKSSKTNGKKKEQVSKLQDIDQIISQIKALPIKSKIEEFINEKDKDKKMTKEEWEQWDTN